MFTFEPLAQDPKNEFMDLSRVNLFTPLLFSPHPGPETGLVQDTRVWKSE